MKYLQTFYLKETLLDIFFILILVIGSQSSFI